MADAEVDGASHGNALAGTGGEAGNTEIDGVDQNAEVTADALAGNTATDEDQTPAGVENHGETPDPGNDQSEGRPQASNADGELGRGTGVPGEESCRTENGVEVENDNLHRRVRELALEAINEVSNVVNAMYSSREVVHGSVYAHYSMGVFRSGRNKLDYSCKQSTVVYIHVLFLFSWRRHHQQSEVQSSHTSRKIMQCGK